MVDEVVDIVDEENNIIENASKSEAHKKGLLHRVVIAEVIDNQGRWTLVKQESDRQDAGQYVSPVGGHIRSGESEKDALKREAYEEMGLEGFTYKRIGEAIFNRHVLGRHENHLFILYEIYSNQKPTLNHESESYNVFSIEDLKKSLKISPEVFGDAFHFVVKQFYPNILKYY